MIDKLSYEEVSKISAELRAQIKVVADLTAAREINRLSDFIATVEGYSKFLTNSVEINRDADEALADLRGQ